jgi:DNA helicase TIP49 (TBP-interacting protein)
MCLPRLTPATEVDHINEDATDDMPENLQGLCKRCHSRKTATFVQGIPEIANEKTCDVVLVCGPPGSGKTTWAAKTMTESDVIIDFDLIASDLSGQTMYAVDREWIKPTIIERARRINALTDMTEGTAYITIAVSDPTVRQEWADKLGARIEMMGTSATECKRRIMNDNRRPKNVKVRLCQLVDGWF